MRTELLLLITVIPFQIWNGYAVIETAAINGHGPYRLLIDTGAQATTIDSKVARELSIMPQYRVELSTRTGSAFVPGARIGNIALESAAVDGIEVIWYDLQVGDAAAPPIAGTLGHNFLSRFEYIMDYRNRRLILAKPGALEAKVGGEVIPFEDDDGVITLHVRLCGEQSPHRAILDSGAPTFIVPRKAGCSDGPLYAGATLQTRYGTRDVHMTRLPSLQIGKTLLRDVPAVLEGEDHSESTALLPVHFFDSIYVNFAKKHVILNPVRRGGCCAGN